MDQGIFDARFNLKPNQLIESNAADGNDPDAASNPSTGVGGPDSFGADGLNTLLRPRYNRPEIHPFGLDEPAISIALNTDQSGRTFQDRSFTFNIVEAPPGSYGKE